MEKTELTVGKITYAFITMPELKEARTSLSSVSFKLASVNKWVYTKFKPHIKSKKKNNPLDLDTNKVIYLAKVQLLRKISEEEWVVKVIEEYLNPCNFKWVGKRTTIHKLWLEYGEAIWKKYNSPSYRKKAFILTETPWKKKEDKRNGL